MKYLKTISLILIIGLSISFSDGFEQVGGRKWSSHGPGWVDYIRPINNESIERGWVYFKICQDRDKTVCRAYWLKGSGSGGNMILSVLLSAKTTDNKVNVYYNDNDPRTFYGVEADRAESVSFE